MIGIATADLSGGHEVDEDQPLLESALAHRGLEGRYVQWNDPDVDWPAYDLVVLRSTWDYHDRLPEFLAWLDRIASHTPVLNSPATVRWNCDKSYLGHLHDSGAPVVPTAYVDRAAGLASALQSTNSPEFVVKPTVSASSQLTGRFARHDPAAVRLAEQILATGKIVMLQPYQSSVEDHGELAVIHIDGRFSHAARKGPLLDAGGGLLGGMYVERIEPATVTDDELAAAEQVLDSFGCHSGINETPLYSRVDLVAADDGQPVCLELELIEPSLFFPAVPEAADRLVDAIANRLEQRRSA